MPVRRINNRFIKATTDEQDKEIVDLYVNTDTPIKEIASRYGISIPTVQRITELFAVNGFRNPLIPEDTREQIMSDVSDGKVPVRVAKKYGVDPQTVYNMMKRQSVNG